jgi:hypothetical protein
MMRIIMLQPLQRPWTTRIFSKTRQLEYNALHHLTRRLDRFLSALEVGKEREAVLRSAEEKRLLKEFRSHQKEASATSIHNLISDALPDKRKDDSSIVLPVVGKILIIH